MRYTLALCFSLGFFACVIGCNAPTETIPVISSSGTTYDSQEDETNSADATTTEPDISHAAIDETPTATAGEAASSDVEVTLADFDGLQEKVKSFAGKIVVVDIWSNSCLPCLQEFHHLVELSQKYPERVVCISMNVDYIGLKNKSPESYLPKIEAFLAKEKATKVINLAASEPDTDVLEKYEVESMPAIIIYDPQGKLVHKLSDANAGDDGLSYAGDVIPKLEAMLQ